MKLICFTNVYFLPFAGERQRYTGDRAGFDGEDSDCAEDDDNDNEDEDEDSQAESVLSATTSVTASPQHCPFRNSQQDTSSADEDSRNAHCFGQTGSMDILPKALITRMTALTTPTICKPENHEIKINDISVQKTIPPQSEASSPKSPCHQMSVDYPDGAEEEGGSAETKKLTVSQVILTVLQSTYQIKTWQTIHSTRMPLTNKTKAAAVTGVVKAVIYMK